MKGGCIYYHGGREYWLVCTADAYFEIIETYGEAFATRICAGGRDGLRDALGCLLILAREGELCRRYMGYDPCEMMKEEAVRQFLLPGDIEKIISAVLDTISAGLRIPGKEDEETGPVDVGLAEFEKKTVITHRIR